MIILVIVGVNGVSFSEKKGLQENDANILLHFNLNMKKRGIHIRVMRLFYNIGNKRIYVTVINEING